MIQQDSFNGCWMMKMEPCMFLFKDKLSHFQTEDISGQVCLQNYSIASHCSGHTATSTCWRSQIALVYYNRFCALRALGWDTGDNCYSNCFAFPNGQWVNPSPASPEVSSLPLPELFGKMPWSDCPEAELGEVITYLKRSQFLRVPPEWWQYIN